MTLLVLHCSPGLTNSMVKCIFKDTLILLIRAKYKIKNMMAMIMIMIMVMIMICHVDTNSALGTSSYTSFSSHTTPL